MVVFNQTNHKRKYAFIGSDLEGKERNDEKSSLSGVEAIDTC